MKKIVLKILCSIFFIIPFIFLFSACGNDEVKLTGIEFEESDVNFVYRETISNDPFGTTLIFSDGSRKSINDVAEEDVPDLTLTLEKFDQQSNEYVEIDFMQYFSVGSYRVTYDHNNIHASAYFTVEKEHIQAMFQTLILIIWFTVKTCLRPLLILTPIMLLEKHTIIKKKQMMGHTAIQILFMIMNKTSLAI